MLLNLKRKTTAQRPATQPVDAALHMAITVRLQIMNREIVEPAVDQLLDELSSRLDQVSGRRHAVDFEVAKAIAYWRGPRAEDLITQTRRTLAADSELCHLREREDVETIVFDRHVEALARESILDWVLPLERKARALGENRLNVQ